MLLSETIRTKIFRQLPCLVAPMGQFPIHFCRHCKFTSLLFAIPCLLHYYCADGTVPNLFAVGTVCARGRHSPAGAVPALQRPRHRPPSPRGALDSMLYVSHAGTISIRWNAFMTARLHFAPNLHFPTIAKTLPYLLKVILFIVW